MTYTSNWLNLNISQKNQRTQSYNRHFINLAVILNVAFMAQSAPSSHLYHRLKSEVPFQMLWENFDEVTPIDGQPDKIQVVGTFMALIISVTKAIPEIRWYTPDDLDWFFRMLDTELAPVVVSLFKAWVSTEHTFLTPGQIAKITGTSESNWRNRASGQQNYKSIPGCKKLGKEWLIPLAVLQVLDEIPWDYNPLTNQADVIPKSVN